MDFIEQYLRFIKEAERLKAVTRTAWTHDGRRESTAEHSWRLALFAGLAAGRLPGLNREKVLMMSLIHDMGELYGGDISAALCPDPQEKTDEESRAVRKAFSLLPEREAESLLALWREYNAKPPRKPGSSRRWTRRKPSSSTIRDATRRLSTTGSISATEKNTSRAADSCANSARFWTKKPPPSSTVQIKRSRLNDKGMRTIRFPCLFFA